MIVKLGILLCAVVILCLGHTANDEWSQAKTLPLETENIISVSPFESNDPFSIPTENNVPETFCQIYTDECDEESRFVEIFYPQLIMSENRLIGTINSAIKDGALNQYESHWVLSGLTLKQDYSITLLTGKEISVVFKATPYVLGAAHPVDICHAITVDLLSGSVQNLSNIIATYDDIQECIYNGLYDVQGSLSIYTSEGLWLQIERMYACVDLEEHYNDFYLESDGSLCIIISGLGHGAGDYSIIHLQM